MPYIYKITNTINYKLYVGKIEHEYTYRRWKEHISQKCVKVLEKVHTDIVGSF